MLKGIILVVAIIITFDIGKKIIETWDENEQQASQTTTIVSEQGTQKPEKVTETKAADNVSTPPAMDLTLPDEVLEADFEEDDIDSSQTKTIRESIKEFNSPEKKRLLNAKPLMKFNKEDIENPSVEGAKIDLKLHTN
jgi:hypothetical protein